MNQLLPIIRRVRRPLIVAESEPDGPLPPAVVGNVEPIEAKAEIGKAESGNPPLTSPPEGNTETSNAQTTPITAE